jgi:cold-inducible RNA-binding protein
MAVLKPDHREQPPIAPPLQKTTSMASKLYVGNLSFDTTETDLQDHFAQAGTVTEAALMQDKFTGKSRGFAFVTMSNDEEAQKAIGLFNGREFMNRSLTVNEARPREDRTGGGPRRSPGGPGGGNRDGGNRDGGYAKRY